LRIADCGLRISNVVNHTGHNKKGLVVSSAGRLDLRAPAIAVAIPYDFNRILRQDNRLAIDWRLKTRKIFTHYFNRGYEVSGLISPKITDERKRTSFYILRRKS
jgi:predicted GNAT superfamily acetyltransferase